MKIIYLRLVFPTLNCIKRKLKKKLNSCVENFFDKTGRKIKMKYGIDVLIY
jgi:hypothetical protein